MQPSSRILVLLALLSIVQTLHGAAPITAESASVAVTPAEAITLAEADAVEQLLPSVRARTAVALQHYAGAAKVPEDQTLRQLIRAELKTQTPVVTVQSRPYGDIFKASLTLSNTDASINRMTSSAVIIARRGLRTDAAAAGSLVALVAVIAAVYFSANAFTRGFYRGRLRLAASLAGVAGLAAVAFFLYGWTPGMVSLVR